jgi:hypothetical protein
MTSRSDIIMEEEDEIRSLQTELNEQCKLLAKSEEREYGLQGTVFELVRMNERFAAFLLEHSPQSGKDLILEYRKIKQRRNL